MIFTRQTSSLIPRILRRRLQFVAAMNVSTSSSDAATGKGRQIALDQFALRQFAHGSSANPATSILCDADTFVKEVNSYYDAQCAKHAPPLVDGYAPFCKHIFMPNFTASVCSYLEITPANAHLLRSDYLARTPKELPVLTRFFAAKDVQAPVAKYLDIILYSREQIVKECAATNTPSSDTEPWGIVSIKPQMVTHEIPMQPITMMRNALGVEEGGSGVKLERQAYEKAVEFWRTHAAIM